MNTGIEKNNLVFYSGIKFIDIQTFNTKTAKLNPKKHRVAYPWTCETMKKGKNLFTTSIMDCIAGGIVDDNSVTMFHLCTRSQKDAKKTRQKGFCLRDIERRILEKIKNAKGNLHGLILGGFQFKEDSKYNVNKLRGIKKIFEKHNIPYSIFGARRDVHYFSRYSIFYNNKEDIWYITNTHTNPNLLSNGKREVEILDNAVKFHCYPEKYNNGLIYYTKEEHTGSIEDYFKSQFREVSLSEFDKFI